MDSLLTQVETFLAYDPVTRGLKTEGGFGIGLGVGNLEDLFSELKPVAEKLLKINESNLAKEFGEVIRYRAIFILLPEICLFGRPDEDKPLIRKHLEALGISHNENIVSAIKFICENYRSQRDKAVKKAGIVDVYIKHPHVYARMMRNQSGRCCICGELLIYGQNMHLDHIVPWHLGDDPNDGSNWQLLCEVCNRGKGVFPYYSLQTAGLNWIKPTANGNLREDVRYAVLVRDKKCFVSGKTPKETRLRVIKKIESGCWVLDNAKTISEEELVKTSCI